MQLGGQRKGGSPALPAGRPGAGAKTKAKTKAKKTKTKIEATMTGLRGCGRRRPARVTRPHDPEPGGRIRERPGGP